MQGWIRSPIWAQSSQTHRHIKVCICTVCILVVELSMHQQCPHAAEELEQLLQVIGNKISNSDG